MDRKGDSTTRIMSTASPPHYDANVVIKLEIGETKLVPAISLKTETKLLPAIPLKTDFQEDNPLYQQRKNMLLEYKELFSALLRLPDKEIQKKVLNCINAKHRSVSTQTYPVEISEIKIQPTKVNEIKNSEETTPSPPSDTSSEACPLSKAATTTKKRKRIRKISQPQVNKVSRVAIAKNQQLVKLRKPSQDQQLQIKSVHSLHRKDDGPLKRRRIDSSDFSDSSSIINGIFEDFLWEPLPKEQLFMLFTKDCLLADVQLENGLLPIQDSVAKKQNDSLNRQIYIWKDWKKVDLNDILTDEGEDLLQLGIAHNCGADTAKLLIDKGLNTSSFDDQGNTILHLAVLNDAHQELLQQLMERIDLKMLLTFNDDGYTALHLAVRKDFYLLAECMLNVIDERLGGKKFYNRFIDAIETDEKLIKHNFQEYYEKVCLQMQVNDDDNIINNHLKKQQFLQAVDKRSGNTALFFAIENQSEHMVYFLLAHLTDPRTENFNGVNCKTFFSEYCRTLNLSLNIDSTMEKVTKLLS